jgi:hypothetical protein
MTPGNEKAYQQMTDKHNRSLNDRLQKLAEELGDYGASGDVELTLRVSIKHAITDDTVIERKTKLPFRH